jgi:FkbM family methyltransferase
MSQFLLDLSVSPRPWVSRVFRTLRSAALRVHDPIVAYRLNGRSLALPLSHDLPDNRRVAPIYGDNLRRVCEFLRARHGRLTMIDIGANVGDSWVLSSPMAGDRYLLVEASERWSRLLERNATGAAGVTRVRAMVSDRCERVSAAVLVEHGNGRVVMGGRDARELETVTVDVLVERFPDFAHADLLKVDVEGWDARVLRGASNLMRGARPVLFFEHDPAGTPTGESERVFHELADLGYRRFFFYDHRGFLAGVVEAGEWGRMADLDAYAAQLEHYYYDVCAFHGARADLPDAFLVAERGFYAARSR